MSILADAVRKGCEDIILGGKKVMIITEIILSKKSQSDVLIHMNLQINSCDQNLNRCCEIIELNSQIQGQLFTILNETSREGGHYAGMETIKTRLLPWLGTSCATSGRLFETNSSLIQDSIEKEKQLRELDINQTCQLQELQEELTSTRLQLNRVQQELKTSCAQEKDALKKLDRLNDYEQQIQILRDEISILDAQKSVLRSRLARSRSPSPTSRSLSPLRLRSCSPGRARRTNASRRSGLLARFGDIYAEERLDAETLLRTYISDMEMVRRIIYIAAVESFHAAKMAYRQFKIRVRETLSLGHSGPESLEDAVLDYIVRHEDLYDVQASVNEVIRCMNINPKISFPPEIDFIVISTLIRELCRVAFSMQTLIPPLDIAFSTDGELFSETKYHRSLDSDFTAVLVAYHVWPALMENNVVVLKGEAVTKRGALCCRRSRSKSRSRSCSRNSSPLRCRHLSRSCSPSLRSGSPRR
ncbi:mitochondria-eating protein isoform X4 [Apus apus]|uniref:mitochondria-eating protein isoform X4 n=1 Tax=Apus apus TaxID=8895 RepID=UPI0021F8B885|nr:mitochondria-eating protein isoform X4 [Apus apus]